MFMKHVIQVETDCEWLIGQVVAVFYDEMWDWPSDKYRDGDVIEYHYVKKKHEKRKQHNEML